MAEASASETKEALSIRLSPDEMQVIASGTVSPDNLDEALKELRGKMHGLGLNDPDSQTHAAQQLQEACEQSEKLKDVVLLQGRPPTPPKDGAIEWARDFFSKGFYIDPETGAADYRRLTAETNVAEGDLLATITPPEEGKEGRDVYGHVVPPRTPRVASLRAGNNVRCDDSTQTYYAKAAGRIRHVGGTVSVDDVLTIKGSAGLETGHINHPGALVIGENVDPQTEINVEGDVEVQGYVDAARITCGGSLIVHGGIAGGAHSRIEVQGNVFALFLANVEIDADGDVFVQREINQSKVRSRGMVDVESGRIAGGEICALGGISAERIGTEAGVRTTLMAGYDFKLQDKIESRLAELDRIKAEVEKIQTSVSPLKSRLDKLPPKMRDVVSKLLLQLKELTARQQEVHAEVQSLHEESEARRKREVYAKREITEDVSVTISKLTLLTKEACDGPIKVGIVDGDIRLSRARLKR